MGALLFALPACLKDKSNKSSKKNEKASVSRTKNAEYLSRGKVSDFDERIKKFVYKTDQEFDDSDASVAGSYSTAGTNNQLNWQSIKNDPEHHVLTVQFDFDKYHVTAAKHAKLEENIVDIKRKLADGKTVVVEGHACDSAGSKVYNMALSEKRAHAIADHLIASGIPAAHLKIVGRGSELLIIEPDPARTPKQERIAQGPNRRVEIYAIDKTTS